MSQFERQDIRQAAMPTTADTATDHANGFARFDAVARRHAATEGPRFSVLWAYYRNAAQPKWWEHTARLLAGRAGSTSGSFDANRGVRLAQERSLPSRFWGSGKVRPSWEVEGGFAARKEIVVENDIAWRINAMVDFLFNRPIRVSSKTTDDVLRANIDAALDAVWEASGGLGLLQDAALMAQVFGHVDFLVRIDDAAGEDESSNEGGDERERLLAAVRRVRIETVSPIRGAPVIDSSDYRRIESYVVRVGTGEDGTSIVTEAFEPGRRRVWTHDERGGEALRPRLLSDDDSTAWCPSDAGIPIVRVKNINQPLSSTGLSEVEPLIPLQDELNTRLSDRANRVTMQSFKMYLAKGIEGFDSVGVGPGTVWITDNEQAKVEVFGGDAASPSEESHITEVREAMDKTSGVPPLATGVVRAKIGNLTSENALRIVLQGLLTRTARKRIAWTRGIAEVSRLALAALHAIGALTTRPGQRGVNVEWSDVLPSEASDELKSAQAKSQLGVDPARVLSDLGIGAGERGVE